MIYSFQKNTKLVATELEADQDCEIYLFRRHKLKNLWLASAINPGQDNANAITVMRYHRTQVVLGLCHTGMCRVLQLIAENGYNRGTYAVQTLTRFVRDSYVN